MPRVAANVTQADVARVIRAAKQAGAPGVEIRMGATVVWVPFTEQPLPRVAAPSVEPTDEIVL
jgi:hypothetical protein